MSKLSLEVTSIPSAALVLLFSSLFVNKEVMKLENHMCSTQRTIYKPGLQTESCPSETDVKRI